MYRNKELRKHQYYIQPDWAGGESVYVSPFSDDAAYPDFEESGVYASPSMAGSR
jgi:hypothetical protein